MEIIKRQKKFESSSKKVNKKKYLLVLKDKQNIIKK